MHNAITVIRSDWLTTLSIGDFSLITSYILSSLLVCDSMVFCDFKLFDPLKIDVYKIVTVQTCYLMVKAYKKVTLPSIGIQKRLIV